MVNQIRSLTLLNIAITFLIPGISVYGHLGGLLTGIVMYFIFKAVLKRDE